MLFLISDIHLTDETTALNVSPTAYDVMRDKIVSSVAHNNANELKLVLLGDILDPVRTSYWLKVPPEERPWNGELDPETAMNGNPRVEEHYLQILRDILYRTDSGRRLVEVLKELPTPSGGKEVIYVVGNHDRVFNNYESLRQEFMRALAPVPVRFTNELTDPTYSIHARHGHEWDEECCGVELYNRVLHPGADMDRFDPEAYRIQTIGEVITGELMSGIVHQIDEAGQNGQTDSPDLLHSLMDLNNVRPITDAFLWLEWFSRTSLTPRDKNVLLKALRASLESTMRTSLTRKWDEITSELWLFRGDITDRLDQLLSYIKGKSYDDLQSTVKLVKFIASIFSVFGRSKDLFVEGARQEWRRGLAGDSQYVAYGHTHEARHDFFAALRNGKVQMYLNTGTYLPLIQRTDDGKGFASAHQMTMAIFYNDDEDTDGRKGRGPTMDLWNGIKRKMYV